MAKEFQLYNDKYRRFAGTALKMIESVSGKIAREDILSIHRWDVKIFGEVDESHSIARIRLAVYESKDADEWQKFRVALKGLSTQEKLYCLAWYWYEHVEGSIDRTSERFHNARIRVWNYLGALKRGGQLDSQLRIRVN